MRCTAGMTERKPSRVSAATSRRSEYSPCAFLSRARITSLRSSMLLFAAFAPAPVSREAVSRPLITLLRTPTLKKEMNFSWASISLRAAAADFTRHVEQRTLSQSRVSKAENWQGRDASGVVIRENICIWRLPTWTWSLCHATGVFTIWRSTPVSERSSSSPAQCSRLKR